MINIALIVENAIRAASIPVDGVSIGSPGDRTTWKAQFTPAATSAQRMQAQSIIDAVAVDEAAQAAEERRLAQLTVDAFPIVTKALVLALIDQLNIIRSKLPTPLPAITPAQTLQAIRDKAGTL